MKKFLVSIQFFGVIVPRINTTEKVVALTFDVEPDSNPKIAADAENIIAETRSSVRPGSIILLHAMYPNRQPSLQAVRGMIEMLRQDGYRFVTISELLAAAQ